MKPMTIDRKQMVDKLNDLQHLLKRETDSLECLKLQLSIDALIKSIRQSVREHNKKVERRVEQ